MVQWKKGYTLEQVSKYTTAGQRSTTLLDSGMFTHRVNDRQPIEYNIEGLNYERWCREQGSKTTLEEMKHLSALWGRMPNLT